MKRETFIERAYAYSEKQAKLILARRIAKKHGVLPVVVNQYLKEHPACFKIEAEIEFKEIDEDDTGAINTEKNLSQAAIS